MKPYREQAYVLPSVLLLLLLIWIPMLISIKEKDWRDFLTIEIKNAQINSAQMLRNCLQTSIYSQTFICNSCPSTPEENLCVSSISNQLLSGLILSKSAELGVVLDWNKILPLATVVKDALETEFWEASGKFLVVHGDLRISTLMLKTSEFGIISEGELSIGKIISDLPSTLSLLSIHGGIIVTQSTKDVRLLSVAWKSLSLGNLLTKGEILKLPTKRTHLHALLRRMD